MEEVQKYIQPEEEPDHGTVFEPFKPYALEAKVNEATEAMEWIKKSDNATIELARQYARRIDLALAAADAEPFNHNLALAATKALYLGPHLLNTLRALAGTPGDRVALEQLINPPKPAAKQAAEEDQGEEEDSIADFLRTNLGKTRARE